MLSPLPKVLLCKAPVLFQFLYVPGIKVIVKTKRLERLHEWRPQINFMAKQPMLDNNPFSAFRALMKLAPLGQWFRDTSQVDKDKLYPLPYQHTILSHCMCSSALLSPVFSILNERTQLYMLCQLKKSCEYFYMVKLEEGATCSTKALEQTHSFELSIRNVVLWLPANFYLSVVKRATAKQLCPKHSSYISIILHM